MYKENGSRIKHFRRASIGFEITSTEKRQKNFANSVND